MSGSEISRRAFVADSSKVAAGVMIVPRHVLGGRGFQAPSDTLNIAIGIGTSVHSVVAAFHSKT